MGLLNNDIVQLSWRGRIFGQRILMVRNYLIVGDYNVATSIAQDLDDIKQQLAPAGAFDATTAYLACLPPEYKLEELRAQRLKAVRSAMRSTVFVAAPGTNANSATVPSDSAAITFRTDLAGRSQISTVKVGPLPDAASAAGFLTAPQLALHSTLATKLLTQFTPAGSGSVVAPVVVGKSLSSPSILTTAIPELTSRVITRRTVGRGE